jgi:hypothetical protein
MIAWVVMNRQQNPPAPFIRPTSSCSSLSLASSISFSSNFLWTHLHNGRSSTPLLSIRYALFFPRRRVYPSPAHTHPQRAHARTRQRCDVFPPYPLYFHTLAHCASDKDAHPERASRVEGFFSDIISSVSISTISFVLTFLRTLLILLHSTKDQLLCFQMLPHSLPKTTRGGGTPLPLSIPLSPFALSSGLAHSR